MFKPIQVGDLVVVVRTHCANSEALGLIRTVSDITSARCKCAACGVVQFHGAVGVLDGPAPWARWHIPIPYLKRIPPPGELGIVDEREELHV